jgi:3-isopropylmalate/(R)-2-methylmalate dehydratase large subunit
VAWWKSLATDADAQYDKVVVIDAADIAPSVTWGTSPEDVLPITATVPAPESFADPSKQDAARKSLEYMGLEPGTALDSVEIQNVFIGSCTNSRIEDLRAAAAILKGRKKADNVRWAIVVPGSGLVKAMAEDEGLDVIFKDAGLEWREPGCSACLGMNPDKVPAGNAARPLPTAISSVARGRVRAPTWSARRWPLPLPSPAA